MSSVVPHRHAAAVRHAVSTAARSWSIGG